MATFPLGAAVTLEELDRNPHAVHARLRGPEPVSWLPCLEGWLITRRDLALVAMRDDRAFTVQDARFTTARVIGPSMLSLDGAEHVRHRTPFVAPFRIGAVRERFAAVAAEEVQRLLDALAPLGRAELRRGFAGPMAATIVARALGLGRDEVDDVLSWYEAIVASVTGMSGGQAPTTAGERAFAQLGEHLERAIDDPTGDSLLSAAAAGGALSREQIVSNAAVLLFGGIETTEGMIANALLMLLEHPDELELARADSGALDAATEESLRLEPAAAVIDRYATTEIELGGAKIAAGELVRISIAAANRDPAEFDEPDRYRLDRPGNRHLAFAQGPHVCVGVHLARLEARAALGALLGRLPGIRLDPAYAPAVRGLVFRKPPQLRVRWG